MIVFLGLCIAVIGILFTMYYNLMDRATSRKEYIDELRNQRPEISKIYKNCLEKGLDKLEGWFGAPHSAKALIFNTFLAIFYTISFFVISWLLGRTGHIGTISVLPDSLPTIGRILFLLVLVLVFIICVKYQKIDSMAQSLLAKKIPPKVAHLTYRLLAFALIIVFSQLTENRFFYLSLFALYSPTLALALAFAGFLIGVIAITIAVAVGYAGDEKKFRETIVFTVTIAVAYAYAFAILLAVKDFGVFQLPLVIAVALAVGGVGVGIFNKKKFLGLYSYCVFMIFLFLIGVFFEVKFLKLNSKLVSYLFFIIILPFINGFVDFVSFWVSRLLGREILKDKTIKAFLCHLTIDFAAAVLLLVLLVFGICFGMELFNNLIVKKPDLIIDLSQLIADAKKAPFGPEGLWITFMLFSTLVPTFAHFVIAFIGIYTVYLTPSRWRQKIADILEENRSKKRLLWPICYFTMRPLFSILFAVGFWGLLGYAVNKYIIHFADLLSKVAYWGIELARTVST